MIDDTTLYIRVACLTCCGSRRAPGHHDPLRPAKWKRCPYCDIAGMTFIEASETLLVECLASRPAASRTKVLQRLSIKISEEI
jgi:hypothetical protein